MILADYTLGLVFARIKRIRERNLPEDILVSDLQRIFRIEESEAYHLIRQYEDMEVGHE